MVTACKHTWRWLSRPTFTVNPLGGIREAFNVECTRCGCHSWQHGTMPNAKPETVTISPTTRRS